MHVISTMKATLHFKLRYFFYHFPHEMIFCAHLPKSGSTWFANVLAECIPGMRYYHPPSIRYQHTLTSEFLSDIKGKYCVVKEPLDLRQCHDDLLSHASRYIIMVRDIRDIVVSYYYMMHNPAYTTTVAILEAPNGNQNIQRPWTLLSRDILDLNQSAAIDVMIREWLPSFWNFASAYFDHADHKDTFLIRYEDLIDDVPQMVLNVCRFFSIHPNHQHIDRVCHRLSKQRLKKNTWKLRKGISGEWRHELTQSQSDAIWELCGQTMERYEYRQ